MRGRPVLEEHDQIRDRLDAYPGQPEAQAALIDVLPSALDQLLDLVHRKRRDQGILDFLTSFDDLLFGNPTLVLHHVERGESVLHVLRRGTVPTLPKPVGARGLQLRIEPAHREPQRLRQRDPPALPQPPDHGRADRVVDDPAAPLRNALQFPQQVRLVPQGILRGRARQLVAVEPLALATP